MSRLKVIVSVFLLLSVGVLIGAIGSKMLLKHRIEKNFFGNEPPGVRFFNKLTHRLDLSPPQKAKINDIIGQAREELLEYREKCRPEFRKLIRETMDKIVVELDDSQKRKLDRYTQKVRKRGRRFRPHPPPPPLPTPEEVIDALDLDPEHKKEVMTRLVSHLSEKKQKETSFREARHRMMKQHRVEMGTLDAELERQLKTSLTEEQMEQLKRLVGGRKPLFLEEK